MAAILTVEDLSKHFGGLAVLNNVSFEVQEGEVLGLIGPNGAGKTTAINVISGLMKPSGGRVHFKGQDVTGMATHLTATRGMARTFQIIASFQHLSVFDHLFLSCLQSQRADGVGMYFSTPSGRSKESNARQQARELVELMHLTAYENAVPRHLPHGHQRWMALGMALALRPSLLLLDEPLSGMNATEMDSTLALLREIKQARGLSILLIEHNMRAMMNFCDRIVVLQYGQKICEGTPAVVREDPAVVEAYLGGEDASAA